MSVAKPITVALIKEKYNLNAYRNLIPVIKNCIPLNQEIARRLLGDAYDEDDSYLNHEIDFPTFLQVLHEMIPKLDCQTNFKVRLIRTDEDVTIKGFPGVFQGFEFVLGRQEFAPEPDSSVIKRLIVLEERVREEEKLKAEEAKKLAKAETKKIIKVAAPKKRVLIKKTVVRKISQRDPKKKLGRAKIWG